MRGFNFGERQGNATALALDVADHDAVTEMIQNVLAQWGRVDYLFNNAGIVIGGEARDITIDEWRRVIEVNLFGVINGIDAVYPIMVKQRGGHIVNMASIEGLIPFPAHLSYGTSKYAVVGLSHGLRIEGAPLGVKVSVVCPGYIDTPIFTDSKLVNLDREKALSVLRHVPSMSAEECARQILRGVERNKATIVVTKLAKLGWWLHRMCPRLMMRLAIKAAAPLRRARIER